MTHFSLLREMFLNEGSFSKAIPADDNDLSNPAFSTQDGQIPIDDLIPVGNGGYVFWDNQMYVEVFVHISPGNWETVENEQQYDQLPPDVRQAYEHATGSRWPGPGTGLKRLTSPSPKGSPS